MTAEQKQPAAKNSLKDVVAEGTEKLEQAAQEAKQQVTEAVGETQEKLQTEAKKFNGSVQEQLSQLKKELLQKIESLKGHFGSSQKDLGELKEFVKTEFNAVIEDLNKIGKELKADVSQISVKHKDQLTETFKRSKEHTWETWKKVVPAKEAAPASETDTTLKS